MRNWNVTFWRRHDNIAMTYARISSDIATYLTPNVSIFSTQQQVSYFGNNLLTQMSNHRCRRDDTVKVSFMMPQVFDWRYALFQFRQRGSGLFSVRVWSIRVQRLSSRILDKVNRNGRRCWWVMVGSLAVIVSWENVPAVAPSITLYQAWDQHIAAQTNDW